MIASTLPDLPLSLLSNWFLQNWVERSFMMRESALKPTKTASVMNMNVFLSCVVEEW